MLIRQNNLRTWLIIAILAVGTFSAGVHLRGRDAAVSRVPITKDSIQANALLKLTPECAPVTPPKQVTTPSENRELVNSVVRLLKSYYVEEITPEKETQLARGAVRGMLDSLADADSRFVDPTERKLLDAAAAGKFYGIGSILATRNQKVNGLDVSKLVVVAPMPGSPAEAAGVKPGDYITHIDGKWIITHNPFDEPEVERLRKAARNKEIEISVFQKAYEAAGKKLTDGTTIADALSSLTSKTEGETTITIDRPGQKNPIELKVPFRETVVPSVTAKDLSGGMLYVHISQFNATAPKAFAAVVDKYTAGRKVKGIVLDLRNSPGGLLDSAVKVVTKINGGGVIGKIQEKGRTQVIKTAKAKALGLPIVVLTNNGTASVAELAAAYLHEVGGAQLIGTKTFGDGLVQTPMLLKDGSAAVFSTGRMITPKGYSFDGKGIEPDKTIVKPDAQLDEARRALQAKIGRV